MKNPEMKNRLVRMLAIMLTFVLLATFPVGCVGGGNTSGGNTGGGGTGSTVSLPGEATEFMSETVSLPESTMPAIAAQDVGALATQQYITARLYLDDLINFDLANSSIQEFALLYDETISQFELAEEYATQALAASDLLLAYSDSASSTRRAQASSEGHGAARPGTAVFNPFALTQAFAAGAPEGPEALREWAQNVEDTYNNLPAQAGIFRALGEQLGTDAKTAREMLAQAKKINEGTTAQSEAEHWAWWASFHDTGMKTAMATKTTCKVALLVGGTVASGGLVGASGALATTSLVVRSADALVEVGQVASTIILGEDHNVTTTLADAAGYIAPVAAVFGVLSMDFSSIQGFQGLLQGDSGLQLVGAVDFIGNALVDLLMNDRYMGIDFKTIQDANNFSRDLILTAIAVTEASLSGNLNAEVARINEFRARAGLDPLPASVTQNPPPAPTPPLVKAQETTPQVPIKSVEAYLKELIDWMEQNGIISAAFAQELRERYFGGAVDTAERYVGTFVGTASGNYGPDVTSGTLVVSLIDKNTNTYSVHWSEAGVDSTMQITFIGQINNGHFQSTSFVWEGVESASLSLNFSEDGSSVHGPLTASGGGADFGLTFSLTRQ